MKESISIIKGMKYTVKGNCRGNILSLVCK